jgi:hypothetical protein
VQGAGFLVFAWAEPPCPWFSVWNEHTKAITLFTKAVAALLCLLFGPAVDLQSKITPSNGKKVTGKDFNAYLAANKVRQRHGGAGVYCISKWFDTKKSGIAYHCMHLSRGLS